jgi:chaperonin GroES
MKLVPLTDRIVIKKLLNEETTKSGIVLPGQDKEKPAQGEVIAVGPGGVVDGKEIKMEVKPGQHIVYSRYAGTDVELDGEKFVIIRQGDVLAIIEG